VAASRSCGGDDDDDGRAAYEEAIVRFEETFCTHAAATGASAELWASRDTAAFVRARPLISGEAAWRGGFRAVSVRNTAAGGEVAVHTPGTDVRGSRARLGTKIFPVDAAFGPSTDNAAVFDAVGAPLVRMAVGGATSSVIAFGQTSSGKTYTTRALLEMASAAVFAQKAPTQEVLLTIVEILGNDTSDMLDGRGAAVRVMEDRFGAVQLVGAEERRVDSAEQLLRCTETALAHRVTRSTERNPGGSSRTHAIVRIRVHDTDADKRAAGVGDGMLFVVDLAGSERAADRSAHSAEALAESRLINTSLATLKACIVARAHGKQFVPFRQSRLTLILRDCFELAVTRPSWLAVIACVSPLAADASHTENTLRYATELRSSPRAAVLSRDPHNPVTWTGDEAREWLRVHSKGDLDPTLVLQNESDNGRTLAEMPEQEFVARATAQGSRLSLVRALKLHAELWALVADARSNRRKRAQEQRNRIAAAREREAAFDREMVARNLAN